MYEIQVDYYIGLHPKELRIINYLKEKKMSHHVDIAAHLHLEKHQCIYYLHSLYNMGLIDKRNVGTEYYWIPTMQAANLTHVEHNDEETINYSSMFKIPIQ
ncbi:MAG: FaeA/PapI family transcriptional regulator [Candidatus Thorarchaeota archaeon]